MKIATLVVQEGSFSGVDCTNAWLSRRSAVALGRQLFPLAATAQRWVGVLCFVVTVFGGAVWLDRGCTRLQVPKSHRDIIGGVG